MDSGQRRGLAQVQSIAPAPAKPWEGQGLLLSCPGGQPSWLQLGQHWPSWHSQPCCPAPRVQHWADHTANSGPMGKAHSGKERGAFGTVTSSGSWLLTQHVKAGGTLRSGSEVSRVCVPVVILFLLLRSEPGRGRKGQAKTR